MTAALRVVVSDTGPINYLVLIGLVPILEKLFGEILIPAAVRDELTHEAAPVAVRDWLEHKPDWVEVREIQGSVFDDASLQRLDEGEWAAIDLAASIDADLLLMDDRDGVAAARSKGFKVTGTLGILDLGARRGMVDLNEAFARLRQTNFRYPPSIMEALLKQHSKPL